MFSPFWLICNPTALKRFVRCVLTLVRLYETGLGGDEGPTWRGSARYVREDR